MVEPSSAVFVYLRVCARQPIAPANRSNCAAAPLRSVLEMRVDAARDSELRAKLRSQNQCRGASGWRVLLGFYAAAPAWRRDIRPAWSRAAQTQPWEEVLRAGLRLAARHALHGAVYVSAAARGSPPSPLLRALQTFAGGDAGDGGGAGRISPTTPHAAFWRLVCSPALLPALSDSLDRLTRSWTAAGETGAPLLRAASAAAS
jgi:hypothetical protein